MSYKPTLGGLDLFRHFSASKGDNRWIRLDGINLVDPLDFGSTSTLTTGKRYLAPKVTGLQGYAYRKKITLTKTNAPSAATTIRAYIKFTNDADLNAHVVSPNGYDIRFTDSDGTTILSYERISYTKAGGYVNTAFFVKVPSISSSANKIIYIYYGNVQCQDSSSALDVWGGDYQRIYHFKNPSSLDLTEAISGTYNLTNAGGVSVNTSSPIGLGASFSASSTAYLSANDAGFPSGNLARSFQFWLYPYYMYSSSPSFFKYGTSDHNIKFASMSSYYSRLFAENTQVSSSTSWIGYSWHYYSVTYMPGTSLWKIYRNNSVDQSGTKLAATVLAGSGAFTLGEALSSGLSAIMAEFRVANYTVSQAQAAWEYFNMLNPATTVTFGTESSEFSTAMWYSAGKIYLNVDGEQVLQATSSGLGFPGLAASSILKIDSNRLLVAAISGTDYEPPLTASYSIYKASGQIYLQGDTYPSGNQFYGTDASGNRGWRGLPMIANLDGGLANENYGAVGVSPIDGGAAY